jgi:hypothetical protein
MSQHHVHFGRAAAFALAVAIAAQDHAGHTRSPAPPRAPSDSAPGAPAATLRPDTLDSPAPTSLQEAARGGMSHPMGEHGRGAYRQVDADLVPDERASGHGTPASAPTNPTQDPGAAHAPHRHQERR